MSLIAPLTKIIKLKISLNILERSLLNVSKIEFFIIFVNKESKLTYFLHGLVYKLLGPRQSRKGPMHSALSEIRFFSPGRTIEEKILKHNGFI